MASSYDNSKELEYNLNMAVKYKTYYKLILEEIARSSPQTNPMFLISKAKKALKSNFLSVSKINKDG